MDGELSIVKISQHGFYTGNFHGMVMVRVLPLIVFSLVAIFTFFAADKSDSNARVSQTSFFYVASCSEKINRQ